MAKSDLALAGQASAVVDGIDVLGAGPDGTAKWELCGEIMRQAVTVPAGTGGKATLVASLRVPDEIAALDWLRRTTETRQVEVRGGRVGSGYKTVLEEHGELAAQLWERFGLSVQFRGSTLTPDQIDSLDSGTGLKRVIMQSAMDVYTSQANEDEAQTLDDLFGDPRVIQEFKAATAAGDVVRVPVVHRFSRPTEADRRERMAAVQQIEARRERSTVVRWERLAEIYGRRIEAIDGCLWRGAPCCPANRSEWVHRVPLAARVVAAMSLMDSAETKNG